MTLSASPFGDLERSYGVQLNAQQRHQVRVYLELLRQWSGRINLTALERTEDILRRHFFESFWVAERFLGGLHRMADIGTGAGFPGLAFALYRPDLRVALLEKNWKKVVFLKEAAYRLELAVEIVEGRAEEYSGWAGCPLASIRALQPWPELLERLAGAGADLLLLHGGRLPAAVQGYPPLHREKLPHGSQLYATRLSLRPEEAG